jgi:hypothetical protein
MDSLTSLMPLLTGGAQLASAGSNLYQGYENQQYQDKLRSLAQNPGQLQQYEQGFVQPLNAGLTAGVANQAQAYAAERGLGQSPGPSQEIEAQAIAPYVQQNQQQGYQNALQALGLGGGAQPQNTQQGLTQLFSGLNGLGKYAQLNSGTGAAGYDPNAQLNAAQEFSGLTPAPTYAASTDYTIPTQGLQDFSFGS